MDIRATLKLCRGKKCTYLSRHWTLEVNSTPVVTIFNNDHGKALDAARSYLSGDRPL